MEHGRSSKLLKNTAIVSIGKICTQFITFLLLPIYTAVLTKEEYGIVDLLNTLTSLLLPIITFQIEQGIFRYLIDYREDITKQRKLITTIFKFIIIQLLIGSIIFLCVSFFINNVYKHYLAINILFSIFSGILLQVCRGLGDNKRFAIGSFISGSSAVILNLVFIVVFRWGAYGMLSATILANILCIIYIIFTKKIYKFINLKEYDKNILKQVLKYSIPLIPNSISWWIVAASDRTIISLLLNVAENGIYSAANKFSNVFTSLYSVFNLTWSESAAININSEDKDQFFSNILDVTVRFFGSIAIAIITTVPFVFSFLINESFHEAYYQIPILIVGSMFNVLVSFIGSIYVAKKITKEIAKTSILAAIINIVINLSLIKFIGLYAASISTLVSYLVMFIYRYIDSKKYVNLKFNKKILHSMLIVTALSITTFYIPNKLLQCTSLIIAIVYSIYINKNSANYIIKMIIKKIKNTI